MVRGEEAAYAQFHELYFDRLWRYLIVVTRGDEDTSRDVLQLALSRVVRYIKVFESETEFWNWLAVLARTAFLDETRKRRRYLAFLDRFTRHVEVEEMPCLRPQAEELLGSLLLQHLSRLSPEDRRLLEAKYFECQPVRDIAQRLHTTEKSIESRLSRVRRKLKDAILADLKREHPGPA